MAKTWLSYFTWQLHGNSTVCTRQTKALNVLKNQVFLVNFHGNFQAKPNFVHGKTWQLILQTKIYFIFFLIWRIFLLIFLKQGREYKKNREISWLLTIL